MTIQRFEVGKIYLEYRRIILDEYVVKYRVDRRTDKSVWVSRIKDDGSVGSSVRYKIHHYGDECEYIYGRGLGNPRSVWYESGVNLFAKDVE